MDSMSASSTPTWLDGFGDWAWPGLRPAAELAPAARLRAERPRGLPRPLRLARLALLVAVAGGTFVVSNGLARSGQPFVTTPQPLRLAGSLTNPFAVPSAPAAGSLRPTTTALGGLAPAPPAPPPRPLRSR